MKGRECGYCKYSRGTHEIAPEWKCPKCDRVYGRSTPLTDEEQRKFKEQNRKYIIKRKHGSIKKSGGNIEGIVTLVLIFILSAAGVGCFVRGEVFLMIITLLAAFITWVYTHYRKEQFKAKLEALDIKYNHALKKSDNRTHAEKLAEAKKKFSLRIQRRKEKEDKKTYLHSIYIPDVLKKIFWLVLCIGIIAIVEYRGQALRGIAQNILFDETEIVSGTIVGKRVNEYRGKRGHISEYYRIQYSYKVNGKYYSSTHFSNAPLGHDLERVISSYNVGDKLDVYYDAGYPSVSVIEKIEPTKRSYVILACAIFFLGIGIWMCRD